MKKTTGVVPFFTLCILLAALSLPGQSAWDGLQRLTGTWKLAGKPQFENWEPAAPGVLLGESYQLAPGGDKKTTEYLRLARLEGGGIVYQATAPNQNNGTAVDFPLTFFTTDSWTFENPDRDFPQKIEYWLQDGAMLRVTISGGEEEPIVFWFDKVPAEQLNAMPTLQGYDVFISSRNTATIKRFDAFTGQYKGEFGKEQIGGEAQDVAIGPDGMLYATSLQTQHILKFNPATGDFIGPFTSGYDLQQPTKIRFGSDGFVYVSQWGGSQSSVVRFDAATGVFDRACTGSLNGPLGQAWDASGNLYVACFFSRDIRKFSPGGTFLGVATAPGLFKGPSNIWFDPAGSGDLLVADWDEGSIKRLRPEGDTFVLQSIFATGFARLEGVAIGPDGFLYACDWYLNQVKKLEAATGSAVGVYLEGGDMQRPNGLAFWKR
ncbi:MAG: NHL repeat-containing protein [Saprospirales bacterium]|nr:NHL repeat-containing protein [Saprospirales bacterium]